MRPRWLVFGLLALATVGFSCDFEFSHSSIHAPLGTWGEVGIRVYRTHRSCTLPSPDAYVIRAVGAQILGETPWREIQPNVLEKWVRLSLAQVGPGNLKIAKTCSREGYEEARLPLWVEPPAEEGLWAQAWSGVYPWALPGTEVHFVQGLPSLSPGLLTVEDRVFRLPEDLPIALPDWVRVFYVYLPEREAFPLLLVGEGVFLRFDHRRPGQVS